MHEELLARFDYDSLDEETRAFVLQKTAETHGLMRRTAEDILQIGRNLIDVKARLPEMKFSAWLRAEFAFSRQTAYNFMKAASKFGESCTTVLQLPAKVFYELAWSSDAIVAQVETGQLAPTLQAIQAAKKAEQQARHEREAAELELERLRLTSQAHRDELTAEIERLQREMAELAASKVETKEVPVVPPEVSAQLAKLRAQVQTLTQQRDTLSRQVNELGEQRRREAAQRGEAEGDHRIRLAWRQATTTFEQQVLKLLAQWPTLLDAQVFEAEDWNRLAQVKAVARRLLDECQRVSQGRGERIVDATPPPSKGAPR